MIMLSREAVQKIEEEKRRYPSAQAALLPALKLAQKECGYLSHEVMAEVAKLFDLSPAKVESVASFYSLLHRKPVGKYVIQVCTNISCFLLGAETLLEHLKRKLGIEEGETTPDGRFTLEEVECIAACDKAPVVRINEDYYEFMSIERIDELLHSLR